MARRKTVADIAASAARAAVKASEESGGTLEVELGTDDTGEEQTLDSLRQLGGETEYRFVLQCVSPMDRKGTIEDSLTREELPELPNFVRDRYGPGKYSVHAMGPDGYVKGSRRTIVISPLARTSAGAHPAPAAGVASSGGFSLETWMAMQDKRDEQRRQEAREDRRFYMQMAMQLLPALIGRQPTLADQAMALRELGAMQGGSAPEKALEMLTKGLELGKELNQGGATETGWTVMREVLKDLAPAGNKLLDAVASRLPAPAPNGKALPAPAPKPLSGAPMVPFTPAAAQGAPAADAPAPAPPTAEGSQVDMLKQATPLLHKLAAELAEYAENGAAPELAAHAVVAKIPRMVRAFVKPEDMKAWLTHPDWWRIASEFHPALTPHPGFCDDVRQTLLAILADEENAEEEPEVPQS